MTKSNKRYNGASSASLASDAANKKKMTPVEAQRLVHKNSRTIVKVLQLLESCDVDKGDQTAQIVAQKLDKYKRRVNRRLKTLSKWSDTPFEQRAPVDFRNALSAGFRPQGSHGNQGRVGLMAVECLSLDDGRVLRRFNTVRDAANFVGSTANKIYACLDGQRQSNFGFAWRKAQSREGDIPDMSRDELMKHCRQKYPSLIVQRPSRERAAVPPGRFDPSSSYGVGSYATGQTYGANGWSSSSGTSSAGVTAAADSGVFQMISLKDGLVLKQFPSAREACRFLGQELANKIYLCVKGERKQAFGFAWKRVPPEPDEAIPDLSLDEILEHREEEEVSAREPPADGVHHFNRAPQAVDILSLKDGRAMKRFVSARAAAAFLGTGWNKIYAVINGQCGSAVGFGWRKAADDLPCEDLNKTDIMSQRVLDDDDDDNAAGDDDEDGEDDGKTAAGDDDNVVRDDNDDGEDDGGKTVAGDDDENEGDAKIVGDDANIIEIFGDDGEEEEVQNMDVVEDD